MSQHRFSTYQSMHTDLWVCFLLSKFQQQRLSVDGDIFENSPSADADIFLYYK